MFILNEIIPIIELPFMKYIFLNCMCKDNPFHYDRLWQIKYLLKCYLKLANCTIKMLDITFNPHIIITLATVTWWNLFCEGEFLFFITHSQRESYMVLVWNGANSGRRRTPSYSESASNLKILHIFNKAGQFHILFGLNKISSPRCRPNGCMKQFKIM